MQNLRFAGSPAGSLDIGRLEPPPGAVTNREHPDRLSALIDFIYDPVRVRFLAGRAGAAIPVLAFEHSGL
jgi:hypothetical protein